MKSKMVKLAAVAVIIAAALIGMKVLFGLGEPPAEVPVPQPVVSDEVEENLDSPVDIELRQVRQMYAAGDVKGLAAMLAEGRFETKVLAANYLAQMDDGVQALEALENVQAEYGKDDAGNPFTPTVEKIRSRMGTVSGFGGPAPATRQSRVLAKARPALNQESQGMVVADHRDRPDLASAELSGSGELKVDVNPDSSLAVEIEDTRTGPELVEGVSGYAYYFDGAGDYIDIGDDPSIQTEVFTVAAWVATSDRQRRWQTIVSYERGSHAVSVREGKGYYGWQWIFIPGLSGTTDVRTGQWTFVTVTRDSDYRASVYVNGELENSFVNDTKSGFSRTAKIGGDVYDDEYLHGSIDDVAIFNRPLSAEEIQRLYQNPGSLKGDEPGLVGYWSFDNDEPDVVKDSSPYGNHGTPGHEGGHGSPGPTEPESPPDSECRPELTEGASGKGYYFDGDGDHIEIPPIEGLGAEHTKMLWANPDASPRPNYVYLIDQDQIKRTGNNNWIELVGTDEN
ncbi:MAG: LamG domain-containing protein, partial [Planctomycetota bacterium]